MNAPLDPAEPCPVLAPAQAYDTTYFVQYAPFVYSFDPKYMAIHPARLARKGVLLSSDKEVKRAREAFVDVLGKQPKFLTRTDFQAVFAAAKAVVASPWIVTGEASDNPYWGLGVEYAQTWRSLGFKRGRLITSVPLTLFPGAKEVSVRSWLRRTVSSSVTDSTEKASTNEFSGDEKWSLASKKQLNRQNNTTFNPAATVNQVSIPVAGPIPVGIGGNVGISGSLSSGVTRAMESGREFIQSATVKATDSLKISRNSTVSDSTESGTETSTKETISNPNRVNTLNYLYYEVLEDIKVTTTAVGMDLYLFVPLPVDKVTNDWLLRYECVLRPLLPCDQLRAGFDAAKAQLVNGIAAAIRRIRRRSAEQTAPDEPSGPDTAAIATAIQNVLDRYATLSGSSTDSGPGSWLYWEFVKALSTDLRDALGVLDEQFSAASEAQKSDVTFLTSILDQFFTTLGSVDDAFVLVDLAVGVALGTAAAVAGGPVALTVAGLVIVLEALGIDAAPDDEGLKSRILTLQNKYEAFLVPPAVPPLPPAAADGQGTAPTYAEQLQQQLLAEAELRESAAAQVESRRLRQHVQEHLAFYYQAIWSSWPDVVVEQRLREAGIAGLVENRISGFRGYHGAFRVVDEQALLDDAKIDLPALRTEVLKKAAEKDTAFTYVTTVPTAGVVVEPLLGRCLGGDAFVVEHRDLDLAARRSDIVLAEQAAAQAELESERRRALIAAGDLSEPAPRRGTQLEIELADGRPAAEPAPEPTP